MVANALSRRELFALGSTAFAQTEPPSSPWRPPAPPRAYPPPAYYPRAAALRRPIRRGPARLRYEEGDPIPAGYHVVHRSRQGLVIAGTIVFFVSYGIALSVAMIDDFKDQTSSLAVPIAGPWLMMYNRSRPNCDSQTGNGCVEQGLETILRFYLAIDGVAQAAGAGCSASVWPAARSWSATTATRTCASCPRRSARPATARR